MKRILFLPALVILLIAASRTEAQNRLDVLRYSEVQPGNDPAGLAMGGAGVSDAIDFSSIVQNPATAAMFNKSMITINLGTRRVSEDARYRRDFINAPGELVSDSTDYIGGKNSFSDNQTGIASGGMAYSVPTLQGSFVIGVAYNRLSDFNQAFSVNGFNRHNTITDYFAQNPDYQSIGFTSYALDTTATGQLISTLREANINGTPQEVGFKGINQHAQVIERGKMGAISLFGATEFQKNLFFGVALVFPVGKYTYQRIFLEQDLQNLYNTPLNLNDVQYISSEDNIDATIGGFFARFGFVYKAAPWINIGLSYRTRSSLTIKEHGSSSITVKFDGENTPQPTQSAPYKITYKVHSPGRLKAGITLKGLEEALVFHGQAEYVDYKQARLSGFPDGYEHQEFEINQSILADFKPVINLQAGLAMHFGNIIPRIGAAYYPSPRRSFDINKKYLSGGLTVEMNDQVAFDLGIQYGIWDGQDQMYSVGFSDNTTDNMIATQKVHHFTGMAGIRVMF